MPYSVLVSIYSRRECDTIKCFLEVEENGVNLARIVDVFGKIVDSYYQQDWITY